MTEPMTRAEVHPRTSPEAPRTDATASSVTTNLLERSLAIPIAVARIGRDEVFRAVYGAIDWIEGTNQAAFRIARATVEQIDRASRQAVDGVESILGAFVKAFRGSGEAAGTIVSSTVSLVGARQA